MATESRKQGWQTRATRAIAGQEMNEMNEMNEKAMTETEQSEAAKLLRAIARNLDQRDGLRNVLESIARTANEQYWSLLGTLSHVDQRHSEAQKRYQSRLDESSRQLVEALDMLVQIAQAMQINPNEEGFDPMVTPLANVQDLVEDLMISEQMYRKMAEDYENATTKPLNKPSAEEAK